MQVRQNDFAVNPNHFTAYGTANMQKVQMRHNDFAVKNNQNLDTSRVISAERYHQGGKGDQ